MDKQNEIQMAFALWKELHKLAYLLRGIYGHEFFKLIKDASCLPPGITKEDLIPF